ncbi:S53 family peptidase [Oleiagrimonas soli]|uniref:Subtilase family serine protease n=1 Tax=Oleiagrimonas soli TaxID=1543381 RepID=A0A841KM61_9GAMM|nr:S53 family serine peptidase [Oleiagrimonas soli]MBB6183064.1 subtilase family serine protease [Oleiagrimonas soli]
MTGLFATSPARADTQQLGPTNDTITTTIVFGVRNPYQLERYIQETVTPGSPHYRDFLTLREFVTHFAPAPGQLKRTQRYLESQGLTVDKIFDDHLAMTVSGPASVFESVLQTQVDDFQENDVRHHPHRRHRFHRPRHQPRMPKLLLDNDVIAIVGLSNEYQFKPMNASTTRIAHADALKLVPSSNTIATGVPGQYTVADVANLYDINPLYAEGTTGAGTTLGVATYADFLADDAYTYWNLIGLPSKADRISKIHVDGGGDFGADAGSGETSLDVEQAGGLAPYADVVVYDAPNSSQGGIDMFYQVVSDNRVDSLSYSWGLPEIYYYPELNGGVDYTDTMKALNQAFMEAAVQGITLFTASGDSGAYDTNRTLSAPSFTTPLSVDWPSSSPYMTAAGGTTEPVSLSGNCGSGTYPIQVTGERAWSWDYLSDFFQTCYGLSPVDAGIFSSGGGGGVSVYWHRPWYQYGVAGMQRSASGQSLTELDVDPTVTYLDLRANYAGRNVPDISMNADPFTGYLVYSSADGGLGQGSGGTSFVAPQLNGITALVNQRNGGRIGLLAPQLYRLLRQYGYGPDSPFNDIASGDNWFWQGAQGYDPATGVGTPDVTRLAILLSSYEGHGHHGHGH